MDRNHNQKQKKFFNSTTNQYNQNLILYPPYHTYLETQTILKRLQPPKKKNIVCDFGTGSGRIAIPLLQKHFTVAAVDISDMSLKNLEALAKKLSLSSLTTHNHIQKDKKYIAIVGADILHHIDFDEYLPIFYASLQPKGKIIFSEPCAFNPTWHVYLRIASDWEVEKGMLQCTYKNLKKKLRKSGFSKIKITGLGLFPRSLLNWSQRLCRFNDWLGDLPILKLFAYRYVIEAYK